ncbi:hypothetical protein COAQ111491_05885 [Comamonas aquatilis]
MTSATSGISRPAVILLAYAALTTLAKRYYIRRFGWQ